MIIQDRLAIGARLARLQFPDTGSKIEALRRRDANFRDMCERLADLDCALSTILDVPGTRRRAVLNGLVAARGRLTQEMADALSRAEVVPIEQLHGNQRH
jgi:hypothetical protein